MNVRPKLILDVCVIFASITSTVSFAQIQNSSAASIAAPIAPIAASAQTAVPALVPYTGLAVDREGHALTGETGVTFLVFKYQTGGEPLFTETQRVVPDATGHYAVRLGSSLSSGIPIDLFGTGEARWLEVQVTGEPTQPRTLLTSVPYALKAADATTLGGLPASAFMRANILATNSTATPGFTTDAVTPVTTTTGGTRGNIPLFTSATNIENSTLFNNATGLGIGRVPSQALDVNGNSVFRGFMQVSRTNDATPSTGSNSYPIQFNFQVYNTSNGIALNPFFTFQAESTGNDTATTGGTLNLTYYSGIGAAKGAETGLYFNPNGIIHFAPGQTFPGGVTAGGSAVCIATGGGFGSGGTTFINPTFNVPGGGGCTTWSGFTKTASTVVLTTNGSACVSTDAKKITLSLNSADPDFLGAGTLGVDYIQMTRTGTTGSFTTGTDQGQFPGSAAQVSCTASLLQLNEDND